MIDIKFLGITVTDKDDYGTLHLRLALDLLQAIKSKSTKKIVKGKARNIIQVRCEPVFDNLIQSYSWSRYETDYADQVLAQCIDVAAIKLLKIANRRIKQKHKKRTKLQIEDLKLAAIMAYVMDVHNTVCDELEETFLDEHGAMYFSS